jgi:adenylate cyclase
MNTEGFKRRLSAILSADVVGYSRLMGEDEAATVKTITTYREVLATVIKQHRGRMVDSPGDNVLAEFTSVVDAGQCAVAIQKEIQVRNAEFPEERRMRFRIGINLGDIIEEGERIYGDGVNIASRLEELADPGGICVSKTAFDQIETKLPLGYEYMGEQTVKNIAKPIGAYRVLMDSRVSGAADKEKGKSDIFAKPPNPFLAVAIVILLIAIGFGLAYLFLRPAPPAPEQTSERNITSLAPETHSIAVLPFVNVSGDLDQEYFSDGITEELICALAKLEGLKVISRTSAFYFKGKDVDLRTIGEQLNVENVLEGSVRTAGNQIRLTAQLIRVSDDTHLWSETYNRELKDVFAIQEEISKAIVDKLKVQLLGEELPALIRPYTANMEARNWYFRGRSFSQRGDVSGPQRAIEFFEKAIKADPANAPAYIEFSRAYGMLVSTGAILPREAYPKRKELIAKALEIDDKLADAHVELGVLKANYDYDWKGAETDFKRALELNPGSSEIHSRYGLYLSAVGRMDEAIEEMERALQLDPLSGPARSWLGMILIQARRFDQALETLQETLEPGPPNLMVRPWIARVYVEKGLYDMAITMIQELTHQGRGLISEAHLAYVYAKAGKKEDARETLDTLLQRIERGYFAPYSVAEVYSALEEEEKAFEWLDRAYEERDPQQVRVKSNPAFDNLHSDPRWIQLLKKMGLVD